MIAFDPIFNAARERIGAEALQRRLPEIRDAAGLAALPDDRYLSQL